MEGRMNKYNQVSPERAKVWTEKSPKYHQNRKVPVVYSLSRNRQLEHPHFMEVLVTSPQGLYLKDVISRLNSLRGRGMASLYSWSSERSSKKLDSEEDKEESTSGRSKCIPNINQSFAEQATAK